MNYEQSIIFTFLNNPGLLLKHQISPSDFTSTTLAEAYVVMRGLEAEGKELDLVVIIQSMKSPDATDVMLSVNRLGTGTPVNINHYISSVKAVGVKKKLHSLLNQAIQNLSTGTIDSVIGDLSIDLSSLKNKDIDHAYTSKEMMHATVDYIDKMHDLKNDGRMAGVPSGLKKLDKILGGFHKSDLVIVGARPAVGKTSLAISCALNAAKKGFKVGFISTEMSVVQVGMRVTSLISNIPATVMRDSDFEENDWPRLTTGTQHIANLPFYVYDKPVCRVSDIAMQSRAWVANDGLDILYVDYLTRLKPESSSENKTIAVGNIVTDLKSLARSIDIPVICLAQLNRLVESRADKRPNMGDLRDSGVIEQEADQILMLCREKPVNKEMDDTRGIDSDKEYAEILIEKNRHGATAGLLMRFKPETMEWCDKESFDDYEYR